jgi:hypothetical protein
VIADATGDALTTTVMLPGLQQEDRAVPLDQGTW